MRLTYFLAANTSGFFNFRVIHLLSPKTLLGWNMKNCSLIYFCLWEFTTVFVMDGPALGDQPLTIEGIQPGYRQIFKKLGTLPNGASLSYFQPKNQLKISAIFSIFTHEKHAKNIANAPGISPAGQASKTSLDSAEICREDGSAEAEILQANRRTL
jgi:hypothetical protein